ncbi:MAG: FAD-dependent oxidoreductase, partial [bacterium]|nr:FAD-dependent oxidoreductase [bacterium]
MKLVELETDILVAGGGLAGVCAAITAARHGSKVVLVQNR